MRRLIYIPIIHMEADLGSIAPSVDQRSRGIVGEERWEKHKKTVADFWDAIAVYLDSVEAKGLNIYQDGLVANGELGMKIVQTGANMGSKNHEILLKLINRGAELVRTEDIRLVREEYERLINLAQSKSVINKALAYLQYKMRKARLTKERDKAIAERIDETLPDEQTGILFLGAYHDVLPFLAKGIAVKEVKEQEKVRAYFNELIGGRDEARFEELSRYLVSPVALNEQ